MNMSILLCVCTSYSVAIGIKVPWKRSNGGFNINFGSRLKFLIIILILNNMPSDVLILHSFKFLLAVLQTPLGMVSWLIILII